MHCHFHRPAEEDHCRLSFSGPPPGSPHIQGGSKDENILELKFAQSAVGLEPFEVDFALVPDDGNQLGAAFEVFFLELEDLLQIQALNFLKPDLAWVDRHLQPLPRTHGAEDFAEPDLTGAITAEHGIAGFRETLWRCRKILG